MLKHPLFKWLFARLKTLLPWLITFFALYIAFRDVEWETFFAHTRSVHVGWLVLAFGLTGASYLMRSRRWQHFFPEPTLTYRKSATALFLGFFMNNILPARTGELVRAHLGSRLSGKTRTLVLATIASERLADGLTISAFFLIFTIGLGDTQLSRNLYLVVGLFALVAVGVMSLLFVKQHIFTLAEKISARFNSKVSRYTADRFQIFIEGLRPLFSARRFPMLLSWSILIWSIELAVYYYVTVAFGNPLPLSYCALFLVAVNFSSLIPAAPGGFGVIEAIASAVLVSVGIEKELALTMVISQHLIQYFLVGIPGIFLTLSWKKRLKNLKEAEEPVKQ